MKNKSLSLLLLLPVSIGLISCGKKQDKNTRTIRLHQTSIEGSPASDYFKVRFDEGKFIEAENKPIREIANFGLTIVANASPDVYIEMKDAKYPITSPSDTKSYYDEFGFVDVEDVAQSYEEEPLDGIRHIFAHKPVTYKNREYDLIVIEFKGSTGTDWASNFDVGCDNDDYYNKTGEHPLWVDKNVHKGFDVSAEREYNAIKEYLYGINEFTEQILYIFSHSRGAAISNVVSAKLLEDGFNLHSYNFAVPNVATNVSKKYDTIFNFLNEADPITKSAPASWGFDRLGIDHSASIYDYVKQFNNFNNYTIADSVSFDLADLFECSAKSREDMYRIDENLILQTGSFDSEQEAIDAANGYPTIFDGVCESIQKFVSTKVVFDEEQSKYVATMFACPAFVSEFLSCVLKSGTSSMSTLVSKYISQLLSFISHLDLKDYQLDLTEIMNWYKQIYDVHMLQSYKVLLDHGFKGLV